MSHRRFLRRGLVLVAMLLAGLLTGPAWSTAAEGRRSYTGTIDGADYRVEVPERWNGTLVLYSHGYYPEEFSPEEILLATRAETATWLLAHGYAIAASNFKGTFGFVVKDAQHDQIALLDWFEAHVGRPQRTIASGMSMGGAISMWFWNRELACWNREFACWKWGHARDPAHHRRVPTSGTRIRTSGT